MAKRRRFTVSELKATVVLKARSAEARIGHFMIQVSNKKRSHSALGYLTPIECDDNTCLNFANFWSK